jgi:putative glutamine amidotransferase
MADNHYHRVRIGVPFRTAEEEAAGESKSQKIKYYYSAVEEAGAEAVGISLQLPAAELARLAASLDGFVLPGSPCDVDPARYGAAPHPETHQPDPGRERTDFAVLEHAFAAGKPVLAICYGTQLLNVYLGGSLIQDIPSEVSPHLQHEKNTGETVDPEHLTRLETDSRLLPLAGSATARINSSHHQAIRRPGRSLRVTAEAPDGVIEAVEWTGGANWAVGVQWHPERMAGDEFAAALFRALVMACTARPPAAGAARATKVRA